MPDSREAKRPTGQTVFLAIWVSPAGVFLWAPLIAAAFALLSLARRRRPAGEYRCPRCGHAFAISGWTEFASVRWRTGQERWRYLRCPRRRRMVWMRVLPDQALAEPAA